VQQKECKTFTHFFKVRVISKTFAAIFKTRQGIYKQIKA